MSILVHDMPKESVLPIYKIVLEYFKRYWSYGEKNGFITQYCIRKYENVLLLLHVKCLFNLFYIPTKWGGQKCYWQNMFL